MGCAKSKTQVAKPVATLQGKTASPQDNPQAPRIQSIETFSGNHDAEARRMNVEITSKHPESAVELPKNTPETLENPIKPSKEPIENTEKSIETSKKSLETHENSPNPLKIPLEPSKFASFPLTIDLQKCYLSGKWYILRNAISEEIDPALNRQIEEGFYTGQSVIRFSHGPGECVMDYVQGEITFNMPGGGTGYSIARKIADYEELWWTGEDGLQRPFPPDAESFILGGKEEKVRFEVGNRGFEVCLTSMTVTLVETGQVFPLSRV